MAGGGGTGPVGGAGQERSQSTAQHRRCTHPIATAPATATLLPDLGRPSRPAFVCAAPSASSVLPVLTDLLACIFRYLPRRPGALPRPFLLLRPTSAGFLVAVALFVLFGALRVPVSPHATISRLSDGICRSPLLVRGFAPCGNSRFSKGEMSIFYLLEVALGDSVCDLWIRSRVAGGRLCTWKDFWVATCSDGCDVCSSSLCYGMICSQLVLPFQRF